MAMMQAAPLMKEIESCLRSISPDKQDDHLHNGLLLCQKTKKYCVDKFTGRHSFTLYARDLNITDGDDKNCWRWHFEKEDCSCDYIEVAEGVNVCRLDVRGTFDTSALVCGAKYEVSFLIKMKTNNCGFENPVTLKLELPTGEKHEHREYLNCKPKEKYLELRIKEFEVCDDDVKGDMTFSMLEVATQRPKKGLVIKGVVIRRTA